MTPAAESPTAGRMPATTAPHDRSTRVTEIVKAEPIAASLPDMVRYAEHLADANLLPGQYRGRPANVLYAMEYGRTLGITPLAAITGIHVIEGKPSASAALISGLVRQAGHKLRVKGNGQSATAQVIRCDDPEFIYEVTWELRRNQNGNPSAEEAGLLGKDVWKKYAAAMLKARAISQVARDACEEVLFGLHYTPEELGAQVDADGEPLAGQVQRSRPSAPQVDEWSTPAPAARPGARDYVVEAREAETPEQVREIWRAARDAGLDESSLGWIASVGRSLAAEAPVSDAPVVDGEVVSDTADEPSDDHAEHAAAVADLRAAAADAGLAGDFEQSAHAALGVPLSDASAASIRALAATIREQAA